MSNLITATLLDNINWFHVAPASWKERAYNGLVDTLKGVFNPTPQIERGMAFERVLCGSLTSPRESFLRTFKDHPAVDKLGVFYDRCKGGVQQRKVKKIVEVDGEEYLLYGKIDIAFPDRNVDIKTTGKYKGKNTYLDKTQHHIYAVASGIPAFEYIIAEFEEEFNAEGEEVSAKTAVGLPKCVDVYTVPVTVAIDESRALIETRIREAISFMTTDGELLKLYNTSFCRY